MSIHYRHPFMHQGNPPKFWLIYVLSILFNFHTILVAYSNSTYMESFATPEVVGLLFSIGSAIAVFAFLFISRVLQAIGNVRLTIGIIILEIISLLVIGIAPSPATTIVAFVVFLALNPLLYLTIDVFSETLIGNNEHSTGSKRGFTLTLMSIAAVSGPIIMALIIGDNSENIVRVYFASATVASIFLALVVIHFPAFKDPKYHEVQVLSAIHDFWQSKDVRNVFLAHFILQIFFSWMIIFFPLYLATVIGYSWNTIGYIIAAGLFAYVIFEYPIGYIADRYIGEKEMMALGFLILAVSSSWIVFMNAAPIIAWMILMFVSRIGASLVEATTESYFFKHTDGSDANTMSFFRLTRPLALLTGSLLGSFTLLYMPLQLSFAVLGGIMIIGMLFVIPLTDTK